MSIFTTIISSIAKLPIKARWLTFIAISLCATLSFGAYFAIKEKNEQIAKLEKSWSREAKAFQDQIVSLQGDNKAQNKALSECDLAHRKQAEDLNKIITNIAISNLKK